MDATERCATQRGWRTRFCDAAPEGRWWRTRQKGRRAKSWARRARHFARHTEFRHLARQAFWLARRLLSLARKRLNLARRVQSRARRVAPLRVQSKKPCAPSCCTLPAKLSGRRVGRRGLRAALPGLRTERTSRRESAHARLGSVNGTRYSADDTNTNTWGRGMGACAWVLGRSGRMLSRDGWGVVGGRTAVSRGAFVAAVFRAGQNRHGWQTYAGKPLKINYLRPWVHSGAGQLEQHAAI